MDANKLMADAFSSHKVSFDVIDLDPYGSAVPFLDSALKGAKDNCIKDKINFFNNLNPNY
jgi:tRNA G26 N,N-dimethylase Trm1